MPERQHRRYSARTKARAVGIKVMDGVVQASEAMGIPASTIEYWAKDPRFADLREKTREELGVEAKMAQQMVLKQIIARIPEFEPRDLSVLYGILTDKAQLLTGAATSRSETRDITMDLTDHEIDSLTQLLDDAAKERDAVAE